MNDGRAMIWRLVIGPLAFCTVLSSGAVAPSIEGAPIAAQQSLTDTTSDSATRITPNDNETAAGELRRGVLTIRLVATTGVWFPEDDSSPGVPMQAFGVEGKAPTVPAPLIRVPEGTEVIAIVRNAIPNVTLRVHGLQSRPAATATPLAVRPGEQREIRFKSGAAGTYHYWATTTNAAIERRLGIDSQLSGAFIVDERGPQPRDRVLVIGQWAETLQPTAAKDTMPGFMVAVNGRSWPHTERLTYRVGDSVRGG